MLHKDYVRLCDLTESTTLGCTDIEFEIRDCGKDASPLIIHFIRRDLLFLISWSLRGFDDFYA